VEVLGGALLTLQILGCEKIVFSDCRQVTWHFLSPDKKLELLKMWMEAWGRQQHQNYCIFVRMAPNPCRTKTLTYSFHGRPRGYTDIFSLEQAISQRSILNPTGAE
jgi:hypothetical protein